jgi:hypothetical protein
MAWDVTYTHSHGWVRDCYEALSNIILAQDWKNFWFHDEFSFSQIIWKWKSKIKVVTNAHLKVKERKIYINIFIHRIHIRTQDFIYHQAEAPVTHMWQSGFEIDETKVGKLVSTCPTPLLPVSFISTEKQQYKYLRARITVTGNKWNARHVPLYKANIWATRLIGRLMRKQLDTLFKPALLYNFLQTQIFIVKSKITRQITPWL